jgi:hypothetical protein
MMREKNAVPKRIVKRFFWVAAIALCFATVFAMQLNNLPNHSTKSVTEQRSNQSANQPASPATPPIALLSDPFLQRPTDSSVQVVWFTEFKGSDHTVTYGDGLTVKAVTTQLSRAREDSDSRVQGRAFPEVTRREIWRHEATVAGLKGGGNRLPYAVTSQDASGQKATSKIFTLAANPSKNQPLKILLTSDHQLKPMTPANLQKVTETISRVDAVFFAGDLVDVPDRASEWFDNAEGLAFFPSLQGRANYTLEKDGTTTVYTGGELIQHAPLFPTIGNHEVMGRYSAAAELKSQFANSLPRNQVSRFYPTPNGDVPSADWVADHSYNTNTYEEIFSLPTTHLPDGSETQQYYAVSFGDIRLISLYVTQVWRFPWKALPSPDLTANTKGRYRESAADLNNPEAWGYGQHIFADIRKGSPQYQWLQKELARDKFKNAKYKIVMLHHPPHTLGGNIVPAFTDPVPVETRAADNSLQSVQYEYPKENDYLIRDLVPLLEKAKVQLVFYGHSHLWNRFVSPSGLNFLETSNVGNSYGAHSADNPRGVPTRESAKAANLKPFRETYSPIGDPNGLNPVMPTIAPLKDNSGNPQPTIASNDITSFTIFDTDSGTLSSYYFDTRSPNSAVVKFDEFKLAQ